MSSINVNQTSSAGNDFDQWFLETEYSSFETGAQDLMTKLVAAEKDFENDPSDPKKLAAYQAALESYQMFRNAQTNVLKVYKDIDSSIIQNFR